MSANKKACLAGWITTMPTASLPKLFSPRETAYSSCKAFPVSRAAHSWLRTRMASQYSSRASAPRTRLYSASPVRASWISAALSESKSCSRLSWALRKMGFRALPSTAPDLILLKGLGMMMMGKCWLLLNAASQDRISSNCRSASYACHTDDFQRGGCCEAQKHSGGLHLPNAGFRASDRTFSPHREGWGRAPEQCAPKYNTETSDHSLWGCFRPDSSTNSLRYPKS